MGIMILVFDDYDLAESEIDQHTETLTEFVNDRLGTVLESTDLHPYLIEALAGAMVIQANRARPEQLDNIELLEEVEVRGQSCDACACYQELLRFLTCAGTSASYYSLRRLMDLHDVDECWATTFLGSDDTLTAQKRR